MMLRIETGLLQVMLANPEAALAPPADSELRLLESEVNSFGMTEHIPPLRDVADPAKREAYYSYDTFCAFRSEIAELARRFREIDPGAFASVERLFNADDEPVTLHLLPIGNPWGDAFVRDVAGRPEIFVNLAVVARRYGQDNDQRWATLLPVLAHELFHIRFARQRAQSDYWRSFLASGSPLAEARLTILDEGIAHFLGHQDSIGRYLVEQREPLRLSLAEGREALARLADPALSQGEAGEIIVHGTVGRFFTKYLCMSGMLAAYVLHRNGGDAALRRSLVDIEFFEREGLSHAGGLLAE